MAHQKNREWGRRGAIIFLSIVLALPALRVTSLAAEKAAPDFYKGAVLRIVAPYAPGGSSDSAARAPSLFFGKYLGAKVVVENMPGAGGYVGLRYIYSSAKRDGLTVGMFNPPGSFMAELLGQKEATWKLQELSYVGRVLRGSGGVMMVGKGSSIRTLDDLLKAKREIKCGTIDPTTASSMNAALAAEGLGLNLKIVPGFPNGKACSIAVMRGEIEMTIQPPAGFEEDFKKGDLRAICIVAGREVAAAFRAQFASVPRLIDLSLSSEKKRYIDLADSLNEIGFVMAGPPGIPKDRVQFLDNALAKSLKEPDVIKMFEVRGDAYSPMSGTEYLQLLKKTEKGVADISAKDLNHILFEKYY